jgi:hypothetical protein
MNFLFTRTLLLGFLSMPVFAQTTLTGSIRDGTGKPLPFATIALLSARDSSLVKGTISKETGLYEFENIRPGQYRLSASAVGYSPSRTATFEVSTARTETPALILSESTKTLNEVTVAAKNRLLNRRSTGR